MYIIILVPPLLTDGRKYLEKCLIVMGEIGANDYFTLVESGRSLEEIHSLAPLVINFIGTKIQVGNILQVVIIM